MQQHQHQQPQIEHLGRSAMSLVAVLLSAVVTASIVIGAAAEVRVTSVRSLWRGRLTS